MKNKKIKTYFIKYTLEFFVIVLGISFSFLVQNYRNEIQTDSKRELIINNLLSELESNHTYIKNLKDHYVREMDYVDKLLSDSLTKEAIKAYPENYSPLNPFLSASKFRPSRSIYTSIVNDGSFNILDPASLKALIDDVYVLHYSSIVNIIESEKKIADLADQFFVNHYPETYAKNFWFNNDEQLIDRVFEIMQKDSRFKALMVQKISYMEIKIAELDNYSKKRDTLITWIKNSKP